MHYKKFFRSPLMQSCVEGRGCLREYLFPGHGLRASWTPCGTWIFHVCAPSPTDTPLMWWAAAPKGLWRSLKSVWCGWGAFHPLKQNFAVVIFFKEHLNCFFFLSCLMQRAAVERCPGRLLCSVGNPALLLHTWSPPGLSCLLLQHKQIRPTSSWKWNPASPICTQISSCPCRK